MSTTRKLTRKQAAFVEEFLIDLNATAAYNCAGYTASGHGAEVNAAKLLSNTEVASAVASAMKIRSQRTEISADRVLRELARIAFFDVPRAFNLDGSLKPLDQLDDDTAAAIGGIEVFEEHDRKGNVIGVTKKLKIVDKVAALDKLARHLGLLIDKMKISGDEENPLVLVLKRIQGSALKPVHEGVNESAEYVRAA